MRTVALLLGLALGGCGSDHCLPARATPPPDCPDGTFADATVLDPTCISAEGGPLCRDPTDTCLLCSGSDFADGCRVHTTGNNYECVHRCRDC
jgi:hypothetical protein